MSSCAERMKDFCWQVMTKKPEDKNNHKPEMKRPPPSKCKRVKKRLSTLLHTHVALILLCTLCVLDASCVIGQIISDIIIMKNDLHEKHMMEIGTKSMLIEIFPETLNRTGVDQSSVESMLHVLKGYFKQSPDGTVIGDEHISIESLDIHNASNILKRSTHDRFKRASSKTPTQFLDEDKFHEQYILHELTHAFHLGSMIILTVLVLETFLKVFAMGKKFLTQKLEVFDAFVIIVSWCLDIAFLEGFWSHPESEAANIMMFNLPWRVVRIVNSFVLVIQEKDQVQLKIVKQQYRGSVKRSNDMKLKLELYRMEIRSLHALSRKRGATDREIQACAPEGKRRRSSLLPVLSRLASLSLIGSFSSTSELTKHNHSNDSSDEEESVVDFRSIRNSRLSSISDTLSISRTISTGSSVSTVHAPFTPTLSIDSVFNENPAFDEDVPPNYIEIDSNTKEEDRN